MSNSLNYLILLEEQMVQEQYPTDDIQLVKLYAQRLISNSVAVIFDFDHLCYLLECSPEDMRSYMYNKEYNYHSFEIPKKSGGTRQLEAPSYPLKMIQRWILDHITCQVPISSHAFGFRKKRSILDNAKIHEGQECIVNIDIANFFPSIKGIQIYKLYRYLGYTKQVASILTTLCTKDDCLPQGAPTSPYLSNIVCKKLDKRISGLANAIGAKYSRYADDITLSGSSSITNYIGTLKKILTDEGFIINYKKLRIQFNNQKQMVTGLVVNQKVNVPNEMIRSLRQEIYYCKKYGVNGHMRQRNIRNSNYKEHLYGKAYFIKMINPDLGLDMIRQLDQILWEY
ncbi:retron St85 family RNA-directed DNA polymerase [Paenibacillus sp. 481]|uniref:retron St85 family RNA-directed DNA polymerase n=1 Tax=Paenibacillus sp. 481 TaxID=2835869 RepID=UPI001E51C886|nr:retron St85 family RNA-directed DNA polymerase [Paenibacillus sp. 481]UHA74698.1 retron St85 family RNA-directed DNA polymerase [Paenibacillus sp. 481]